MDVETKVRFQDLKAGKIREIGEVFNVSKIRYEQLLKLGFVKEHMETETAVN